MTMVFCISYGETDVEAQTIEIFVANDIVDIFISRLTQLQQWRKDKEIQND